MSYIPQRNCIITNSYILILLQITFHFTVENLRWMSLFSTWLITSEIRYEFSWKICRWKYSNCIVFVDLFLLLSEFHPIHSCYGCDNTKAQLNPIIHIIVIIPVSVWCTGAEWWQPIQIHSFPIKILFISVLKSKLSKFHNGNIG